MNERNPSKGWTPNWSSRGTVLLNNMETAHVKTNWAQRIDVSKEERYMLRDLLRKDPSNYFYKSLALQLAKWGGLTTKQVHSISSDYEKLQIGMN